jgi:hypothetical protein
MNGAGCRCLVGEVMKNMRCLCPGQGATSENESSPAWFPGDCLRITEIASLVEWGFVPMYILIVTSKVILKKS